MDDLIPIGRFSRMSRLSVKALRLYDDQGLLRPAWVDPSSGYRYYRPGQANLAEAIRILRAVDMPLEEIGEIVRLDEPELISKLLEMHRERLEARLADQERMLRFLSRLIDRKEGIMPYEINVRQIEDQPVVSVTRHVGLSQVGEAISSGFGAVITALGAAGTQPAGAPFVVYHDVIDDQTDGDIEMCVPVPAGARPADAAGEVAWKTLPGGQVAATVHHGPYGELAPAYHTLTGWITDHGHQMAGPPREIYLNDPSQVGPEDLITEVQWPIDAPERT